MTEENRRKRLAAQKKKSEKEEKEERYRYKEVMRKVDSEERLPFTVHLEELRWRMIYCAITLFLVFIALYVMSEELFQYVRKPIGTDLVFLAPAEAFFVYLKLSLYIAVIISMPMILYQMWEFVAPGLLKVERRNTGAFVVFGTIFFVIGAAFCYYMVLPFGLEFLIGYGGEGLTPMISVSNYISFIFKLILAFGVIFEMPIVIVFLTKMGFVTPDSLKKKRSYVVVGSFVLASILTPPDVFTQVVMALPIILLFEGSLIVARFFVPKSLDDEEQ
ncbi:Twin-arginine translocation protein TatC [hydrothermal vent metagenome]|uniref:Twin-arginine translocation protein TatC n=1 Tax=hydrothermal vent metagenome TaxID=652676 RepID=A0A3B1C8W7_9ZZZZ